MVCVLCQVILSCQMDEQTNVPSVMYHVDTDDCGSDVLDYIRDTVQMNNDKLDALLACNACNESTTPQKLGKSYSLDFGVLFGTVFAVNCLL